MARDTRAVVGLVVGLAVMGIIAGLLLPVGIGAIVEDEQVSFTGVSDGETNEVKPGILNVTVDNIGDSGTNISVTLTDVDSGNTLSLTNISQGSSQSGTLEGHTLTVTADSVDGTTADFTVAFPVDYGWSDGGTSLWGILDLIIVLAAFLFVVAVAMKHAP